MFKLQNIEFKNILQIDSIELKEHVTTAILGSSGGGKTTFLKLLNNMISADKGTIYYKDKDINNYDPVELRRKVVMLPQDPEIFKGTIRDNFIITEKIADKKHAGDDIYKNILKQVSLPKFLEDKAEDLSGGEKQRLALARVMLLEPEVLLLDEPSSSLDQETEEKIISMVVNYAVKNSRTLIMVTHSPAIAEKYADRIINIESGRIIK
ncbi:MULTISPECIES: ATP-binding cassette domain-containing protein [unclassified Halanaerobium]|uniref:ABC transporter ATP-binding protein n=1 Tax=unclassified Halanaerobium TaxID=2641197 RepID=UPI000DF3EEE2|nr:MULTISPECIES: ATP-binding cassette domain-containing protein [unclassified Halanaerobium]RCW41160.1 putative ABC transport system ATP-binding protein [Halanaerobium sp. MA284_MarDTE_T2]RCW79596.1 putative ABC transport system ATP-binding protein [Halanaerobium sp. DL-01]